MILKTNCTIDDGEIVLPEKKHFESILDIEPTIAEDFGFAIYLKSGELVGHIAFDSKRSRFELSVGIEEKYRKNGWVVLKEKNKSHQPFNLLLVYLRGT